jgi:hypothetical protein
MSEIKLSRLRFADILDATSLFSRTSPEAVNA